MPGLIQKCTCDHRTDDVRRRFLVDAAVLYGQPIAAGLSELDRFEADAAAILLAFPWMSDAELTEALWALGEARRRHG